MNRPTGYSDWRKIYWAAISELGTFAAADFNGRSIPMDRDKWRLISTIRRLELRMDAEEDAWSKSFRAALDESLKLARRPEGGAENY